jgi:hypothetical protein
MSYPPGVSAGTKRAPWNDKPAPECRCCGELIRGGRDHEEGCDLAGLNAGELYRRREEDAKAEEADRRVHEERLPE